jgi:hypothetical protein
MKFLGLILGYLAGNKEARKWFISQTKKASLVIDRELKALVDSGKKHKDEGEEPKCPEHSKK